MNQRLTDMIKSSKLLIKNNSTVIFTGADKGNTTVVLNRID